MKKTALSLGLLALCAVAAAADDTVRLLPSPLELPRRIGPLVQNDAPHRYDQPALGVSYQYDGPGFSLTVYAYDAGVTDIPDGGDTVPACQQFENAKHDVLQAGYDGVEFKTEQLVRLAPPDDVPLAREAVLELERDQQHLISYIWITGVAGNFVKLRFSASARLRDELPDARRAILSALGAAIKPHLAPVDTSAKKNGTSLNIAMGSGASDDDTAVGLMYLMMLSGQAQDGADAPVCGGEYIPSYAAELAAWRATFTFVEDGPKGKLGKRMAEVIAAGFLEEFVWTELHRDSWGRTAPEGLSMAEYEPWRARHLRRFRVPRFGSVRVDHPRPLPIEPPNAL